MISPNLLKLFPSLFHLTDSNRKGDFKMNTQKMQQLVEQKLLRRNQKEVSFDETPERGKEDVYLDFDTIDALDILNEKERAVIVLRYFEDRKLQEIADVLEENLNTTKSILYRSLGKLRIKLTEGELCHES